MENDGSELAALKCPDTLQFKGQKPAKIVEKRKVAKESEETRAAGHAQPCATHHGPRWGMSTLVRSCPLRCVLCSFGASTWAAGFTYVGSFWASFASFLDHLGSQLHLLITCN